MQDFKDCRMLIVEDEKDISDLLVFHLEKQNFKVSQALSAEQALEMLKKKPFDLIILDLMLPKMDGLELCKRIKQDSQYKNSSIIMLTAKSETRDIVKGLQLGADDYVCKPFNIDEVMARVKALLRRNKNVDTHDQNRFSYRDLYIDWGRHKVLVKNEQIQLTLSEFKILKALAENHGRVLTRDHLLDLAIGKDTNVIDRTIDVHIQALRKKLGFENPYIETIRGIGYRLKDEREVSK